MTTTFNVKQGDLLPSLSAILKTVDGVVIDLTTATSVLFRMWQQKTAPTFKVNAAAVVVVPAAGSVRYDWVGTDTDVVGDFRAEFVITWPGPKKQTVPTVGQFTVRVLDAGLPG